MAVRLGTLNESGEFVPLARYLYRRKGTLLVMRREKGLKPPRRHGKPCKVLEFCPLENIGRHGRC
ncbi:MAG: hypothetical protein JWQ87_1804 [Candidatus Sulfotelmatobacter sp.]|nr:hypothetical protein [Candidatus Sulfotelmatobacter sp.]